MPVDRTQLWSIADEHLGAGWQDSSRGTLAGVVLRSTGELSRLHAAVEGDQRDLVVLLPDELVLLFAGAEAGVRTIGRELVRALYVDREPR